MRSQTRKGARVSTGSASTRTITGASGEPDSSPAARPSRRKLSVSVPYSAGHSAERHGDDGHPCPLCGADLDLLPSRGRVCTECEYSEDPDPDEILNDYDGPEDYNDEDSLCI